jgi:CheY-like chemotaxis protein
MTINQASRILVVDDLADNLLLLQTVLEAEGYEVETALGGYAALDKLQTTLPDLVLLDVMMPDLDGYEVTRRIRQSQQFANLPIFLLSAYDQVDAEQGQVIGATGFLRKPIDFDRLLTLVRDHLSQ